MMLESLFIFILFRNLDGRAVRKMFNQLFKKRIAVTIGIIILRKSSIRQDSELSDD